MRTFGHHHLLSELLRAHSRSLQFFKILRITVISPSLPFEEILTGLNNNFG